MKLDVALVINFHTTDDLKKNQWGFDIKRNLVAYS